MLPQDSEWRRWTALEKVTYLAQLIAPLSLIVTSVFSYLSWREANRALQIQERLFSAQSAPRVEVSEVETRPARPTDFLALRLKNHGESDAFEFCASLQFNDSGSSKERFEVRTCSETKPAFQIQRGSTAFALLPLPTDGSGIINFTVRQAALSRDGGVDGCRMDKAEFATLRYSYRDALGNRREGREEVFLCGHGQSAEDRERALKYRREQLELDKLYNN